MPNDRANVLLAQQAQPKVSVSQPKMEQAVIDVNGCEVISLYDASTDTAWACIASLCEHLGLHAANQVKRLTQSKVYQGFTIEYDIILDWNYREGETRTQSRRMWFIHSDRLMHWLNSIQPSRIKDDNKRERLELFQIECAEVLNAYWRGEAIINASNYPSDSFGSALRTLDEFKSCLIEVRRDVYQTKEEQKELKGRVDRVEYESDRKIKKLEKAFFDDKASRRKTAQRIAADESRHKMAARALGIAGNRCMRCGNRLNLRDAQIDEVFPVRMGGSRQWNNIQILCQACNCARNRARLNWWETDYRGDDETPGFLDACKEEWEANHTGEKFKLQGYPISQMQLFKVGISIA